MEHNITAGVIRHFPANTVGEVVNSRGEVTGIITGPSTGTLKLKGGAGRKFITQS